MTSTIVCGGQIGSFIRLSLISLVIVLTIGIPAAIFAHMYVRTLRHHPSCASTPHTMSTIDLFYRSTFLAVCLAVFVGRRLFWPLLLVIAKLKRAIGKLIVSKYVAESINN